MKMLDLLGSKNLDLPYSNDTLGIENLLKEKFENFINELRNFNQEEQSQNMTNTIEDIKASTKGIVNVVHEYLQGNIIGACIEFNNVMEKCKYAIESISEYYGKRYAF